jgi:hypothetical protein
LANSPGAGRPKASLVELKGTETARGTYDFIRGTAYLMKASTNSTLAATLIATAAGVGAWLSGLARAIWPAHPQLAALALTIVVSIVVKQIWPSISAGRESD